MQKPATSPVKAIVDSVAALAAAVQRTRHRRAVVLAGPAGWGRQVAGECLAAVPTGKFLWIGKSTAEEGVVVTSSTVHRVLGAEFQILIYDAHAGFDPDAFGAATGTLRGGGLLLMLTPPLADWPQFNDPDYARIAVAGFRAEEHIVGRFLGRLTRVVGASPGVLHIEPGGPLSAPLPEPATSPSEQVCADLAPCRTLDQQRAVSAILTLARGRPGRPLVLTADRGRGKSAALGIAAAKLMTRGTTPIIVTAPRLEAAAPAFRHAATLLPGSEAAPGKLRWGEQEMRFVPPDILLRRALTSRLLLVDEAAAIPAPLLRQLLLCHGRIVFSTTVHGYEGSGRGFAVRFQADLKRHSSGVKALRLETPIRWAANDPLERFVSSALLLDASPAPEKAVAPATPATCDVRELDRDELMTDDLRLRELFGLLVTAHYRTRPSDLRNLLDGPNVRVFAMSHDGSTVATAVLALEGGFDPGLAREIWAGRRRPRGHLLAQSLCAHAGVETAATRRIARVVRVAVHPALQRRGLGTKLLGTLTQIARSEQCELLGACFGATPNLLDFWARCEMLPVQVGMSRNAASGSHSVTVIRSLSDFGNDLMARARGRFAQRLGPLLAEPLDELEPDIAARLLRAEDRAGGLSLSDEDWDDLAGFAFAARGYELTIAPIERLVRHALGKADTVLLGKASQRDLLIAKVLQKRSWTAAARVSGLSGKAQALAAMRAALRQLTLNHADERIRVLARRLEGAADQNVSLGNASLE